jgi:hypothetical protein
VYFGYSAPPSEVIKRPLEPTDFEPFRGKAIPPA